MKVFLGADHGGWEMKESLKKWFEGKDYEIVDVGSKELIKDDDFVDYGVSVAEGVSGNDGSMGILLCRNGFGMMITANKIEGIRCGLAFDEGAVRRGREDDDLNCLSIPADYLDLSEVEKMVEIFLETEFSGKERYKRRIAKLEALTGGGVCRSGEMGACCGGGKC